ncbi:SPOR domain-containing protein [Phaeovulum sp. W22_SRMD_FR3]|uniref:SPOR domain-containing protein n=1 Tax=Phaeovulum sp. W22_SRMD_FR3 TaxID=3240274 RepID=UPI003F95C252
MRFVGVVTAGMLAAVLGAGLAHARSLDVNAPAELPSANFKERQYVDSSGCVFIRAGYGGNVTWVPRVGRSGEHVCGYKPSLAAGAPVIAMTAGAAPARPAAAAPVAPSSPVAPPPQVAAAPVAAPTPTPKVAARPLFGAARPGAPMPTIALTTTPPKIGLAAAAARAEAPASDIVISGTGSAVTLSVGGGAGAPLAGPEVPMVATAAGAGGYVSPYVSAEVAAAEAERRANPYVALVPARSGNPRTQATSSGASTAARARTMASPQPGAPVAIISQDPLPGGYSACPNLSPIAQRYMMSNGRAVVRCGPQAEDPVSYLNTIQVPGLPMVAGVAPALPAIPAGYSAVWQDDRLNPARAMGTPEGNAQMALLWDDHVPARLRSRQVQVVAPAAPRVTMSSSNLPAQRRAAKPVAPVGYATAMAATQQPSDAPTQRLMQAARYVQVGTFAEPGNAEASRARLRALGLPVATSQLTQKGRALQVVLAGPFADAPTLVMALSNARAAGFHDAFAR